MPLASTNCVGAVWWVWVVMANSNDFFERISSTCSLSAVNADNLARNERCFVRGQEQDRVGQLCGLARAPKRNTSKQCRLAVIGAGETIEHGGLNRAGRNRIDADAESGGLQRAGFRQAFDGMLAPDVKRRVGRAATAHGG